MNFEGNRKLLVLCVLAICVTAFACIGLATGKASWDQLSVFVRDTLGGLGLGFFGANALEWFGRKKNGSTSIPPITPPPGQ